MFDFTLTNLGPNNAPATTDGASAAVNSETGASGDSFARALAAVTDGEAGDAEPNANADLDDDADRVVETAGVPFLQNPVVPDFDFEADAIGSAVDAAPADALADGSPVPDGSLVPDRPFDPSSATAPLSAATITTNASTVAASPSAESSEQTAPAGEAPGASLDDAAGDEKSAASAFVTTSAGQTGSDATAEPTVARLPRQTTGQSIAQPTAAHASIASEQQKTTSEIAVARSTPETTSAGASAIAQLLDSVSTEPQISDSEPAQGRVELDAKDRRSEASSVRTEDKGANRAGVKADTKDPLASDAVRAGASQPKLATAVDLEAKNSSADLPAPYYLRSSAAFSPDLGGQSTSSGSGHGQTAFAFGGSNAAQHLLPALKLAGASFASALANTPLDEKIPAETATQIVQSLRMQWLRGGGEAEIRLEPKHFGELRVAVKVEDRRVNARLEADAPVVREWLHTNQAALKSSLAEQNLTLARLEIVEPETRDADRRDRQSGRENQQRSRQGRRRRNEGGELFDVVA